MEDNNNPNGAVPKASPCCLPFGKDFLCSWNISGALLDPDGPRPPVEITASMEITTPHFYSGFYSIVVNLSLHVSLVFFHFC